MALFPEGGGPWLGSPERLPSPVSLRPWAPPGHGAPVILNNCSGPHEVQFCHLLVLSVPPTVPLSSLT